MAIAELHDLVGRAARPATGSDTADVQRVLRFKPSAMRIRAEVDGVVVGDSRRAIKLIERGHDDVYYFPKDDVRMDLLVPTDHTTHCPFKGNARYWSIQLEDRLIENAVWGYDEPYEEAAEIAGYVAFYGDKIDTWWEDDHRLVGVGSTDAGAVSSPLATWILRDAWEADNSRVLTEALANALNECGFEIYRLRVIIRTMHPLVAATAYRWEEGEDGIEKFEVPLSLHRDEKFTRSPIASIYEGRGGVRRRISDNPADDDFPILADLRAEGATDYAAMPMRFSDGQLNAITIATRAKDGFSTERLGWLHEIIPALARYYEVHARQRAAMSLMQTFLGAHTGKQVLEGRIHRGDGEDIHAVIWFSDLRNSTPIAEQLGRDGFLRHLNSFFDCMAGAVLENGGEVLRFVGDAVLAIFPIDQNECERKAASREPSDAARRAAAAAREVARRIAEANKVCVDEGRPPFEYGIGLHVGDVTYGNIGTESRLEFTVIGSAANEASRIEGMTKELNLPVVVSETFAALNGCDVVPIGKHKLRGVGEPVDLFTLPENQQNCA
ncbi:MAG: DUF427 domain-containing protein [Rhodospirillales bacterium]